MSLERGIGDLPTPVELRRISEANETAKLREALEKEEEQEQALYRSFLERDIDTEALAWVEKRVRQAAEQGTREVIVLKFPSAWCIDHGRAINNLEPGWPETLSGLAKRAYEVYARHFEPLGYKFRAQVLSYTDEGLGEVGLFLSW